MHKAGHNLIPMENDLLDQVWEEDESPRPLQPANKIFSLPLKFSGIINYFINYLYAIYFTFSNHIFLIFNRKNYSRKTSICSRKND